MALDTTPGGAAADSYASLVEALAYHAGRTAADTWINAEDSTREAALREAARYLDGAFVWTGAPVSATQALTWPRSGMLNRNGFAIADSVIPRELKNAQAELARQLIDADRAADSDIELQGISSIGAGPVSLSFRDKMQSLDAEQAMLARGPELAYLSRLIPDAVRILLVPSWYVRPSFADLNDGFLFDTLERNADGS